MVLYFFSRVGRAIILTREPQARSRLHFVNHFLCVRLVVTFVYC